MGNLTSIGTPFTGGIPNIDWTSLATAVTVPISPHQLRSLSESEQIKDWTRRTTAVATKLAKDDPTQSLFQFATVVYNHAKGVGCDTIFYCPSIIDKTKMICVLTEFDQVTLEHVTTEVTKLVSKWDNYDKSNDASMKIFLVNSISPTIAENIAMETSPDDTSSIIWMRIIRKVLDGSMTRFENKRQEVRDFSPLKEPGQDVSLYCIKVRKALSELWQARELDWILILHIILALSKVTVQQFSVTYCIMGPIADAGIKAVRHMTPEAANSILLKTPYHWIKLLSDAEVSYSSLLSQGNWSPANSPKDKGIPQANLLEQRAGGDPSKTGTCHICKSPDHWANNCPNKGEQKGSESVPPTPPQSPTGDDGKKKPHWKHVPPTDGKTTKTNNNKTYHWCSKCFKGKGQWTLSHTSETHKGKEDAVPPQPPQAIANVMVQSDVSAFTTSWF
jgi:hypothetical protein